MPSDPSTPAAVSFSGRPSVAGPRALYEARLATRRAEAAAAERVADRAADLRLLAFVVGLGLFGGVLWGPLSPHTLWLPLAAFIVIVARHGRAAAAQRRAERAAAFHEAGLRRLDGTWQGTGRTGEGLASPEHLYAADFDITGSGSLFELLCAARTPVGERRLADWLLEPAAPDEIRSRQKAVAELAARLDFRETLALEESDVAAALARGAAERWGAHPRRLHGTLEPWLHGIVAATSTVLVIGWSFFDLPGLPMGISMIVQYFLAARRRAAVTEVLEAADRPAQDLALIGRLLEHLEATTFESPHLTARLERLAVDGIPPSRRIRRLSRLVDFVDARHNQLFLPVSWLLSLGTQLAFQIEAWRAENGTALADWLDTVAEVEALASLAGHASDHPDDPYPEIIEDGDALYDGVGLAHPLLPRDRSVPNDVRLLPAPGEAQAYLISGSNMSGKSTLLRTVGTNAVLAFAGAPICGSSLRLSPLALGASIQVHDSLQEGASRFYAEIARLKKVVDLTEGSTPAFFLLDEVLHGTNSQDRRVGAGAVVATLIERGAIGLVTTHDLALADMGAAAHGRIRNVHFEDQVEDGRMAFDYTLREGVVERSNALALMRMVGLDVDAQALDAKDRDPG